MFDLILPGISGEFLETHGHTTGYQLEKPLLNADTGFWERPTLV
jgi:hypothetical protein